MQKIVPNENTQTVLEFCSSISPLEPFHLLVKPEPRCQENECFQNVLDKIKRDKGKIQYGWQIWLFPGIFIEAEFHAIWVSPNGKCREITPKNSSEILFLPDPRRKYKGRSRNNIRRNLTNNQLIDRYLEVLDALGKIYISFDKIIRLQGDELLLYQFLGVAKNKIETLIEKGYSLDHPCECQSGKIYGECCDIGVMEAIQVVSNSY